MKRILSLLLLPVVLMIVAGARAENQYDPSALYLQWQRDPTTTMTVHWFTVGEAKTELHFRKPVELDWKLAKGTAKPLVGTDRIVHTVEITGLTPATDYTFCFKPGEPTFKFRTMPKDLSQPVRFVTGGDVYGDRTNMGKMNALAGKLDASFVVLGGDLAYSTSGTNEEKVVRWLDYFASWKTNAVAPDGRLIPMLAAIGNHEVRGSYRQTPDRAASYYTVFSMPGAQGYNTLDFGKYLSLFLLDSDHTHTIAGAQTEWLAKNLAARSKVPHVFPFYHTPGYPGFREDTGTQAKEVRTHWSPLFDKYNVKISFENHDHAFKRSHPLRGNKVDPTGTVYLGDGAWGVGLRKPDPNKPRWYIARSGAIRHLYLVTLFSDSRHVLAINESGEIFDEVYQRVK